MPSKKSTQANQSFNQILSDVFWTIGRPVTTKELQNVLIQMGHGVFEPLVRLSQEALKEQLRGLIESGKLSTDATTECIASAEELTTEELRAIFAKPEYAGLAMAISRALPSVDVHGLTSRENLQRDIRNAFFSGDTALLNDVLLTMRRHFPKDFERSDLFDFLFDEPEDWLLSLPEAFQNVCAWRLMPSAILSLRPIHSLAEKLYLMAENAQPMAVSSMLDYALICGDWKIVPTLMRRLPQNHSPRMLRLAWARFISGRDEEAIALFRDALEQIRQNNHEHDCYFKTIGGIFCILAPLREGSQSSLQLAQMYARSACHNDTCHAVVYELLDQVARAKANPDLPPFNPVWKGESRLNNIFACIAHYWLTGNLDGGQRLLLESATNAAREGGYIWLAEECEELLERLHSGNAICNRWHKNTTGGRLPFLLDCVLTRNSWVDRLAKLEQALVDFPTRLSTRLAWFVNADQTGRGFLTVKPIEQHSTKSGKWTKGRRYTGYREQDFEAIVSPAREGLAYSFPTSLTPQDKFACDILREVEEELKNNPEIAIKGWSHVMEALVGHPRLFLEGGDNQPLHCIETEPAICVKRLDDALQYSLVPESNENDDCVVRLERGDQICVYEYNSAMRRLRSIFSGDFRIPDEESPENKKILNELVKSFRIISDEHLKVIDLPVQETDSMPYLQLVPKDRGLRVELMVRPFGTNMQYYRPGEGPRELIYQEHDTPRRMVRNPELETERAMQLVAECPRLVAVTQNDNPWQWNLEGLACYELTLQLRDLLDKCHVQWPSDQKFVCNRTLSMSNVSLHTQSYLSWFSVDGEVKLEDTEATTSLAELIQAAADKKHFVSLSDGQVVALSESLRKHLEELSRLGEITREKGENARFTLRVCRFLVPFLGESIAAFPGAELPPESNQWIQQYNASMAIAPKVPKNLKASLRPYQEEGFLWLSRLDAAQAGACLADDMGLGKTLQAITLILAKAVEGPALIVAPTSVCANWAAEFKKFAPDLTCEVFGPGDRTESFRRLGPKHILITSYGLLQSEQQAFKKARWRVAVLDEAQAIKNAHAKRSQAALEIHADFRIVTTGTPVENNLGELWSIFNFIIPGLLGSRENFQRRFATAIEHDNNTDVTKTLRGIVSPFLLRRRKDQVLNDLPPKEEIDYPVELTPEERAFYDNLRLRILADLDSHDENEGQRHIRVLSGITKLRLAVDHPRLVPGGENLSGAKLEAFLELLRRILQNGHKVLVFSQFVKFLEIVRETLDTEQIPYEYLDGGRTPKERTASVDRFQKGDVPVFLISLKAGGLGLNLTQADYVIHLDSWWNPAVENQASDRAHRLGQNKKVTIYHLQTVNTIEDKIKALHKRKRDLADNLLSEADTIETTPLEELLKLLREG